MNLWNKCSFACNVTLVDGANHITFCDIKSKYFWGVRLRLWKFMIQRCKLHISATIKMINNNIQVEIAVALADKKNKERNTAWVPEWERCPGLHIPKAHILLKRAWSLPSLFFWKTGDELEMYHQSLFQHFIQQPNYHKHILRWSNVTQFSAVWVTYL